jgi:hypothetical protein
MQGTTLRKAMQATTPRKDTCETTPRKVLQENTSRKAKPDSHAGKYLSLSKTNAQQITATKSFRQPSR